MSEWARGRESRLRLLLLLMMMMMMMMMTTVWVCSWAREKLNLVEVGHRQTNGAKERPQWPPVAAQEEPVRF